MVVIRRSFRFVVYLLVSLASRGSATRWSGGQCLFSYYHLPQGKRCSLLPTHTAQALFSSALAAACFWMSPGAFGTMGKDH
jgi:hypothetical protein